MGAAVSTGRGHKLNLRPSSISHLSCRTGKTPSLPGLSDIEAQHRGTPLCLELSHVQSAVYIVPVDL